MILQLNEIFNDEQQAEDEATDNKEKYFDMSFEEFYATEFGKVRTVCGFNPEAGELIRWLKEQGVRLILATQPVFPEIATMQRIRWAGLDPADFELVTTYENARFTKPNPAYYREILEKADLEPENCLS